MKRMTFNDYDALVERLKENPYQCNGWWPSPEELDEKLDEINPNIPFLIWIVETNPDPETEEEKASKRHINRILRENLKLYDPEDN